VVGAVLMFLLGAGGVQSAPDVLSAKNPAEDITGVWNMTARQVYPFLMILRREGHAQPSFWVGRNEPGPFTLRASHDVLDGSTRVEASGNFVVRATHTPPRGLVPGQVPGGAWGADRKKMEVALEFQSFTGFKLMDPPARREATPGVRSTATASGIFRANGKRAPFTGQAIFEHAARRPLWTLRFKGRVEGAALGLGAPFDGPIDIEIETESPASDSRPKLDDASESGAGGVLP
jgi:hypothetical protein